MKKTAFFALPMAALMFAVSCKGKEVAQSDETQAAVAQANPARTPAAGTNSPDANNNGQDIPSQALVLQSVTPPVPADESPAASVPDCMNGGCNWNNAAAYCQSHGGRLPTAQELRQIYDAECAKRQQSDTCKKWYWSSTEDGSLKATGMRFYDGDMHAGVKGSVATGILCMHSEKELKNR